MGTEIAGQSFQVSFRSAARAQKGLPTGCHPATDRNAAHRRGRGTTRTPPNASVSVDHFKSVLGSTAHVSRSRLHCSSTRGEALESSRPADQGHSGAVRCSSRGLRQPPVQPSCALPLLENRLGAGLSGLLDLLDHHPDRIYTDDDQTPI